MADVPCLRISNTQVRTGNKQTPPQTQWGDSGSCCTDCTAEQEEETSHQTQARKELGGGVGVPGGGGGGGGGGWGGGGGAAGGTNRQGGFERKQDVLGLYLLPLPLSRSSSYLR